MTILTDEITRQTRNAVIGNILGHAGITYWVKQDLTAISPYGAEGYYADFLVTGFLFCSILACIYVFLFRSRTRQSGFADASLERPRWVPANPWMPILIAGLAGLASVLLPLLIFVVIAGAQALSPMAVAVSKGLWAGASAAIVVPLSIRYGVASVQQQSDWA
ncbi:MAG: hypothetical protein AAGG11_23040 [Pseudomonadota bacterium]